MRLYDSNAFLILVPVAENKAVAVYYSGDAQKNSRCLQRLFSTPPITIQLLQFLHAYADLTGHILSTCTYLAGDW